MNEAQPTSARDVFIRAVRDRLFTDFEDRRLRLGLPLTDEALCLYRGALCLMVGETGAGKSSVATHLALSAAYRQGRRVLYISTEDGADLFAARAASWFYGMNPRDFMFGQLPGDFAAGFSEDGFEDFPLELESRCRRVDDVLEAMWRGAGRKVDMVVLDYIQALCPSKGEEGSAGDRRALIASAIGRVRDFCERTGVTVLVLSQARRMKDSEELSLSHAKEAGELENACDIGVLLYAKTGDEAFAGHLGTHLRLAKHKLPVRRHPVLFQRDGSRGGCFAEVDGQGRRTEQPVRWEDGYERSNVFVLGSEGTAAE